MKSLRMALLLCAIATPVVAQQPVQSQQKEYSISLTTDELNFIADTLFKEPFGKVNNLINKIRTQVVQQDAKPVDKKEPDKK